MAVRQILLLGNPLLYEKCAAVKREELAGLAEVEGDLHDTLLEFRRRNGSGRALAAPQIGVNKRLVYMHIDNEPTLFINPELDRLSPEMMEVWDDCLSFPGLLVRVRRHRSCRISYRDREWNLREMLLEDDLSELLQHECDHLDGILAVERAIDGKAFSMAGETVSGPVR